jgi:hypothetical protein
MDPGLASTGVRPGRKLRRAPVDVPRPPIHALEDDEDVSLWPQRVRVRYVLPQPFEATPGHMRCKDCWAASEGELIH